MKGVEGTEERHGRGAYAIESFGYTSLGSDRRNEFGKREIGDVKC